MTFDIIKLIEFIVAYNDQQEALQCEEDNEISHAENVTEKLKAFLETVKM